MQWPADDDGIVRQIVFPNEGWPRFTNDPDDMGGPTKGGITLPALSAFRGHPCTIADLQAVQEPEAVALYRKKYIAEPGFDKIADVRLRTALVDMAVLFGTARTANQLAQAVSLVANTVTDVCASLVNLADPRDIILALSRFRIKHHIDVVIADPEKEIKFLRGWVDRAFEFPW